MGCLDPIPLIISPTTQYPVHGTTIIIACTWYGVTTKHTHTHTHHNRQSVLIAILVRAGALPNAWKKYDVEDLALGLQNFLICLEMLVAAVAHYFVFSHKPYVNAAAAQVPCFTSCLRMLDVRDVYGDVKTHFVDPIPRPSIPRE